MKNTILLWILLKRILALRQLLTYSFLKEKCLKNFSVEKSGKPATASSLVLNVKLVTCLENSNYWKKWIEKGLLKILTVQWYDWYYRVLQTHKLIVVKLQKSLYFFSIGPNATWNLRNCSRGQLLMASSHILPPSPSRQDDFYLSSSQQRRQLCLLWRGTHSFSLSLFHTHSLSVSLSHTHFHRHTLSLSVSLSRTTKFLLKTLFL